ncbi:MAG: ROK family protein [Firmicutes bacterium]|nr:ROK family protein [Bacillota bacterium]
MRLKMTPPLDPTFQPLSIGYRDFAAAVRESDSQEAVLAVERGHGHVSTFRFSIFADGTGHDEANYAMAERVAKTLLWARGGYRLIVAGSKPVYERLGEAYREGGSRAFDAGFMARVYERPFEVVYIADVKNAPEDRESASPIGRHLEGCRIGFDAGGSDRKVSAVIDGNAVYSEEVVWHPKTRGDPSYHYQGILEAMKTAASRMPRVDAIGVSSAGIYIDNRIMAASLFLKVSDEDFDAHVKNMYIDVAKEIGDVPLTVANDGDVTALAGAMELKDGNVLGIAMGTSEAGGFVDGDGNITGWLNELAFVPVDASPGAAMDEWSGDIGCGVKYFSQDAVIKLAPAAGIALDQAASPGEKLKAVQKAMEAGHAGAADIYASIGVYLGYALGWYDLFYDFRHLLLMGRVTSGEGGTILAEKAKRVLEAEFPALAKKLTIHLPDENNRRVGQSVAAASLPALCEGDCA